LNNFSVDDKKYKNEKMSFLNITKSNASNTQSAIKVDDESLKCNLINEETRALTFSHTKNENPSSNITIENSSHQSHNRSLYKSNHKVNSIKFRTQFLKIINFCQNQVQNI
jgi:hypothetical protein